MAEIKNLKKARVFITYDSEVDKSTVKKELPYVIAVLSDLKGDNSNDVLKERNFAEINFENFNSIMKGLNPYIDLMVPKVGAEEDVNLQLKFEKIEDFDPLAIIEQIDWMKDLYQIRRYLSDILAKLDGNDILEDMLQKILGDRNLQKNLLSEIAEPNSKIVKEQPEEENKIDNKLKNKNILDRLNQKKNDKDKQDK